MLDPACDVTISLLKQQSIRILKAYRDYPMSLSPDYRHTGYGPSLIETPEGNCLLLHALGKPVPEVDEHSKQTD